MKRSRRKRSRKTSRKKNKQRSRKMKKRNMKGGKGLFDYVPDFLKAKPKTEINEKQKGSLPGPDGTCPPQEGLITKAGGFFGKGIGKARGLVGKAGGAITSVTQDMTKKTSTPKNPLEIFKYSEWYKTTAITATALRPVMSFLKFLPVLIFSSLFLKYTELLF